MNLKELQNEINKDLDDTLDNSDLTGWINRGLDDLTPSANYQKSTSVQVLIGQKEYPLPGDYLEMVQMVDGSTVLSPVSLRDFQSTGYKLWGNKLILQPVPSEDKTIDLYYHARLPHLVNPDDEPEIPSHFHDLLVLYAVAKAKYQDEEESMQMNAISDYQQRKQDFIAYNRKAEIVPIEDVYGI